MKRALALILSLVMCVGLFTACGEQKNPDGNGGGESSVTANARKEAADRAAPV